jgi:hypothetical protein
MFASNFNPLDALDGLIDLGQAMPRLESVQDTFDWMCENESLELFELVVEQLRSIATGYHQLIAQLDSVRRFFTPEFFSLLDRWGRHPENSFRLEANIDHGVFMLLHAARAARFKPNLAVIGVRPSWANLDN